MKSTQLILALAAATLLGLAVWQLGGTDKAPAASEPLATAEANKAKTSGTETVPAQSTATTDTAQLAVQTDLKSAPETAQKIDTTGNIAQEVQSSGIPSPDAPLPPPAGAEPMKRTPAPGSGASSTPVSLPPPPKA